MNVESFFEENVGLLNWAIVDPNFVIENTRFETDHPVLVCPGFDSIRIVWFDDGHWWYEIAYFPKCYMPIDEVKEWLSEEIWDDYCGTIKANDVFDIVNGTFGEEYYSETNPIPVFFF